MEYPKLKLGFGLMRLPKKGLGRTDLEEFKRMVDLFDEAGGTYYDTAYIYGTSEKDTAKALVERIPREKYTLATKLNSLVALNENQAKKQLEKSLAKTGAGYIDYYLLHALMNSNYKRYDKFDLWKFVQEMKNEGKIRHAGFSFHGTPELLDQILTDHPEVDFVQLQINYADWEHPKVQSRKNYEIARKHGKQIIVMEPVKGGKLANPPEEVQKLMKEYDPKASFASWAIRFAASLEGVAVVLSGMSNVEQMEDNLSYMKDFKPLNEKEREIIRKAQIILGQSREIECTGCEYCVKGCPKNIEIPQIFSAYNLLLKDNEPEKARAAYQKAAAKASALDCIACGQCERACPQSISIIENLRLAQKDLS